MGKCGVFKAPVVYYDEILSGIFKKRGPLKSQRFLTLLFLT
jgi:hypothetical protein